MPDEPPAPAAPLSAVAILFVGDDDGEHNVPSEHRYRTTWRVAMESDLATAFDVLAATSPLPQPGESFRRYDWDGTAWVPGEVLDYYAVVVLRSARRDPENPYWWLVAVSYEGSTDPTAEPAEVDYQDSPFQEFTSQDIVTGGMIANSALDPFEGGVAVDRGRFSLVIVRNVPYDGWDPEIAAEYRQTLNLEPYRHGALLDGYGYPLEAAPGTAKITSLTARRLIRSKAATSLSARYFWQVRAQIDFDDSEFVRPDGKREPTRWRKIVLDAGYRKLVDGRQVQIFSTGQKPTHPPLLDGKGQPFPPPAESPPPLPPPTPSNQGTITPSNGFYTVSSSTLTITAPGLFAFAPQASTIEPDNDFAPTKGSLDINPTSGAFTYTPGPGETGWDSFGVKALGEDFEEAKFSIRILIGPHPVYLAYDVYYPADWSFIAQWVGDW